MTLKPGEHLLRLGSPEAYVDAIWQIPGSAVANLVFAHGAGAGFRHATMQGLADAFAHEGLSTLRFNFPFMQQGKRRVDSIEASIAVIAEAAAFVQSHSDLPLILAGHSFGGRMCSHAVAESVVDCSGLIFCSFPLHVAKKPSVKRAAHMPEIRQPMLFLSGTRDDLADAQLLREMVGGLHDARIHWLETANHSYTILKRTRTNPQPVFEEMAQQARGFVDALE